MCVCVQGHEVKPSQMPVGWRSAGGVYKLQYTHPLCENSLAMVVAVCMGDVLVINGEFTTCIWMNSLLGSAALLYSQE